MSRAETPRCVLVVEGNDAVRDLIVDHLTNEGYAVLSAAGRSDAATLAQTAPDVTVVLTDLSLEDGRGEDVALDVLDVHPLASVLFISGKRAIVMNPGDRPLRSQFLAKPFRMQALCDVVRELAEPAFARSNPSGSRSAPQADPEAGSERASTMVSTVCRMKST